MSAPQTSVPSSMTVALAGQLGDLWTQENGDIWSATNAEASAEIAFGLAVKRGTADNTMNVLTAITEVVLGVTVFNHLFSKPDELGDTGMKPKVTGDVLRMGRIWVVTETNVTPASGVFVRALPNGGNTTIGAFRGTADGTNTIDVSSFAQWVTSGSAGGLALLEVDFLGA